MATVRDNVTNSTYLIHEAVRGDRQRKIRFNSVTYYGHIWQDNKRVNVRMDVTLRWIRATIVPVEE